MTPIDEDNTRYFWFQHRNTDPNDKDISAKMNDGALMAFLEDKEILEDVHIGMKNPVTPNIDLGLDSGAKKFRILLNRRIKDEQDNS